MGQTESNTVKKMLAQDIKVGLKPNFQENQTNRNEPVFEKGVLLNELSKDLYSMFENSLFADVSLKCGTQTFKAHKNILCSRSIVFKAMFNNSMQEKQTDTVVIDDINSTIFRILLVYMYSGQIQDINVSNAGDLLYAADKYHLIGLKEECVQCLISNLSLDNVVNQLKLGDLHDEHLKASAIAYMSKNFSTFRSTQSWENLKKCNANLAMEVYDSVVNK